MNCDVKTIPAFDKQAKRLAKKYPSLKQDLANLIDELEENPTLGKPLGRGFFKIRLAIAAKGKGKSGGARVITFYRSPPNIIFLTSIFDKSEKATISDTELERIFSQLP
jgi:hypothetical protein